MSPHRNWFMTYEKKFAGNVLMGNNAPCKRVGLGSIQIRMHDGNVRTLTIVRHDLEHKKNLISVRAMDSKDFTYYVEGGVMQIKRKGKSAIMQGIKQGNIYTLQGSTMIGLVSIVTQARSHTSNDNKIRI